MSHRAPVIITARMIATARATDKARANGTHRTPTHRGEPR